MKKNITTVRNVRKNNAARVFRAFVVAALAIALAAGAGLTAFAASDTDVSKPVEMVNKLGDFIFSLIRAIGFILLAFGVVQVGLSLKSHDPSQRANGFMTLAGGIIIFFAKEILNLIGASIT
jgi:ABC-type sugar transport system substrate-binding protein